MPQVTILIASDNDVPVMEKCYDALVDLGIDVDFRIASSHQAPERVQELVKQAEGEGCKLFIAGAGGSAHLAGAVAASTARPVIGVPLVAGALGGVDALYSTVNMPPHMPVATVSVGEWGARNAAMLAAQMLAIADDDLAELLVSKRQQQRETMVARDESLQQRLQDGDES